MANSGPVIPAAEVDRLFQPFQRLGPRPARRDGGHGLGLSIVRAIATAHGATITAQARPGGGLAIDVAFPRQRSAPELGDDRSVEVLIWPESEEHLIGKHYRLAEGLAGYRGWYRDVSYAGVALVRALADNTGLTAGLSKALDSNRPLVHDRGRALADLRNRGRRLLDLAANLGDAFDLRPS